MPQGLPEPPEHGQSALPAGTYAGQTVFVTGGGTGLGRTIADPNTSTALLPRSAFAFISPMDSRGNLGSNTFRRGGIRNMNAALTRSWTVRSDWRATFRAESF